MVGLRTVRAGRRTSTLVVVAATLLSLLVVGAPAPPAQAATPPLQVSTLAGATQPGGAPAPGPTVAMAPMGLALHPAVDPTHAYVADPAARVVRRITLSNGTTEVWAGTGRSGTDDGPRGSATFVEPVAVAVDSGGNVFVVDKGAHQVRRIASAAAGGTVTTVAGVGSPGSAGDGGPATQALLFEPVAVALSGNDLYVADRGNGRVRRVNGAGQIDTVALGLDLPSALVADAAGGLFIAEQKRVRRLAGTGLTVVAGNGTVGYSGDGGPAQDARIFAPQGLALIDGDLLIADTINNRVRRVDGATGTGTITTVAGTADAGFNGDGAAVAARLWGPWGVAASGSTAYVADLNNGRVRRLAAGELTTLAGPGAVPATGGALATQLQGPSDVATIGADTYIADTDACVVRRLSGGTLTVVAGTPTASGPPVCGHQLGATGTTSALSGPAGLVAVGNQLYIADSGNHRILRLTTTSGAIALVAGHPDGFPGFAGGSPTAARFSRPLGLGADASGSLYVADSGNHRIRRIPAGGGNVDSVVGSGTAGGTGDGGAATSARLNGPRDVAVDPQGRLVIADTGNHRVRRATVGGTIEALAGTGTRGSGGDGGAATSAQLALPGSVAVSPDGFIAVADTGNDRIRAVLPSGRAWSLAGSTPGYAGDGGPGAQARFTSPQGVALDPDGDVVVADTGNDRVRQVNALGVPSAPTSVSVLPGSTSATVSFGAPAADGGLPVTGYTATASPGGASCTWEAGPAAGPMRCTIAGLAAGVSHTISVVARNDRGASAPATSAAFTPAAAFRFHPVTPTRILDSRVGPQYTSPWGPGQTRDVRVTGQGPVPPNGVSAVVVNITATDTTGPGFATLFPEGSRPGASSVNWVAGQTVANQAILAVGSDGKIRAYNHNGSTAHLILDVVGWFDDGTDPSGHGYHVTGPTRIVDSREGQGTPRSPWVQGQTRSITVGNPAVPAGAFAAVLNVTATDTTRDGFLSLYPGGQGRPNASSVNWAAGQTVANQVSVPLGPGGTVNVYNHLGSTGVVIDVVGYYATGGVGFHPVTPTRVLDSRDGTGLVSSPWRDKDTRQVQVGGTYGSGVPRTGVAAVVANATVTNTRNPGFLLLHPWGTARPNASTVNWTAGETRSNVATAAVSGAGALAVYNHIGPADAVIDLTGWYG